MISTNYSSPTQSFENSKNSKNVSFGAGIKWKSGPFAMTSSSVNGIREVIGVTLGKNQPTASVIIDDLLGKIPAPFNHKELRSIIEAAKKLPDKVMMELTPDSKIVEALKKALGRA